jgi:microcystin-dependent protein
MTTPFLAQIEIFSFNFAPKGWAQCNGQLLPINQNQALFSLLGTTYGGDGRVNFGLPDLRSRVPISYNNGFVLGQKGGEEAVTVTISSMASHTHSLVANNSTGNTDTPATNAALGIGTNKGTANPGGTFNIDMYSTNTGAGVRFEHGRQSGSPQSDAVSGAQHVYRTAGDFPVAKLTRFS